MTTATQEVARPLKVLVPLIKEELHAGDEAGMVHYRNAGAMLLEAKEQVEHGKFAAWLEKHFRLSQATAYVYMKLAKEEAKNQNFNALKFSSINQFRKEHLGYKQTVHPDPWREPVKQEVHEYSKRLQEQHHQGAAARVSEYELMKELGYKIIDIGYKVMATKLHPDKGGSEESMQRLNKVRDKLKKVFV